MFHGKGTIKKERERERKKWEKVTVNMMSNDVFLQWSNVRCHCSSGSAENNGALMQRRSSTLNSEMKRKEISLLKSIFADLTTFFTQTALLRFSLFSWNSFFHSVFRYTAHSLPCYGSIPLRTHFQRFLSFHWSLHSLNDVRLKN